jgi:ABC-2 type transport system ATP-binding protein
VNPQALIDISGLSHTYPGTRRSPPQTALRDVALQVHAGEMVALLGPNGSGKSTLLRILTTVLRPSSGSVRVAGFELSRHAQQVRRRLGVVFQKAALDLRMTVAENLRAAGRLYGMPRRRIDERMAELLAEMELADRRGHLVASLSGGLVRRVELAKALLPDPEILVMDEPTTGMDPVARLGFWRQLEALRAQRPLTVVATSHLLDEAERCDRVAIMHRGSLLACDRPDRLRSGLGQQILVIQGEELEGIRLELEERLQLDGRIVDNALSLTLSRPVSLDDLVSRFGDRLRSLTLAHPSLDDVFVHFTGEHLVAHDEEAA